MAESLPSDTISDDLKVLRGSSTRARLSAVDAELRELHDYCIDNDFSPELIKRGSVALLRRLEKARRRRWLRRLMWLAVVVALVAALLQCSLVYRLSCAYLRLATIKLLPYWDWTVFHRNGCLLQNPYFEEPSVELLPEDCRVCEKLDLIERVGNASQSIVAEQFIGRNVPVIITNSVSDWPAQRLFTLQFLYELYTTDELLKKVPPCLFVSNVDLRQGGARVFLTKVQKRELTQWYAHWENCNRLVVRFFRQFFRRPWFLPPMVEIADRNWILISSDFTSKKYKPLDLATPLLMLVQLKGQNKVKLTAQAPCNETCTTLYTVLHEGEILLWTDEFWLADYMPVNLGSQLNLAILSGGYYD